MTLQQIRAAYIKRLLALYPRNEIDSIFLLICQHLLNYNQIEVHLRKDEKVHGEIKHQFSTIFDRLVKNEPIQYIIGATEFYTLKLKTDQRALIPRQETELLVDNILNSLTEKKNVKIIDLCTGSGCIAIALAKKNKGSVVTATDNSKEALDLAQENSKLYNVNIKFINDSILEPKHQYEMYDLIVSNPPYVRESEALIMKKNVLEYEPHAALFVNDSNPLVFYKAIASFGRQYLNPGGAIWCEINEALGKETAGIFKNVGFEALILRDLNHKDRFVKVFRK